MKYPWGHVLHAEFSNANPGMHWQEEVVLENIEFWPQTWTQRFDWVDQSEPGGHLAQWVVKFVRP